MKKYGAILLLFLGLFAVGLLLYSGSLSGGFLLWDDNQYITGSDLVRNFSWRDIWTILSVHHFTDYTPLNTLLLAIEYSIAGMNPLPFRLLLLFGHAVNATLVYLILRCLISRPGLAFFGACLFLVHPMNVENVAWISEHKTIVSSLFLLLSIWLYMQGCRREWIIFFGTLAMLTKSAAVVLPFLLIAYDMIFLDDRWGRTLPRHLSILLIAVVIAGLNIISKQLDAVITPLHGTLLQHLWGMVSLPGRYILKCVAPFWPSPLYDVDHLTFDSVVYVLMTLAIVTILIGLLYRNRKRPISFGIAWFIILLLPVMNLIPMVIWMADRYLYLPMIGLIMVLVYGLSLLDIQRSRIPVAVALLVILATFSFETWRYARMWQSDLMLWSYAVERTPTMVGHANLAGALAGKGDYVGAHDQIDRAIVMRPQMAQNYAIKGQICFSQGMYSEAAAEFQKAVDRNPGDGRFRLDLERSLMMVNIHQ